MPDEKRSDCPGFDNAAALAAVGRTRHDGGKLKPKRYRPNVAAIIQSADGRVLLGQRSDFPDSWQFPQGGIDKGESPEDAVRREVLEETGLSDALYDLRESRGPYRYDFPSGPDRRGYHGQEQIYFLCTLRGQDIPRIDLARTCGEFAATQWVDPGHFPFDSVPPMKKAVYHEVLRDFLGAAGDSC